MQKTEPKLIRANGIDLCTDTFGDPAKPPLVLIMGLGAQMIAWHDPFCVQLAARGFHVIRFDNRDVGLSTKLDAAGAPNIMAMMAKLAVGASITVPYTLQDMARDTAGLLDAMAIEKAHIVGASMGGMIGQEMAIHMRDRMHSFTSIMSTTGNPKLPQASAEMAAMLFAPAPTDREGYIKHFAKVLGALRGPHFPEEAVDDPVRAAIVFDRGINPPGVARQLAAILKSGDRTEALKKVTTPTLIIHGDADGLVNVAGGKATADAIPGAKLEIIPKMGHSLPIALWPRLIDLIATHAHGVKS